MTRTVNFKSHTTHSKVGFRNTSKQSQLVNGRKYKLEKQAEKHISLGRAERRQQSFIRQCNHLGIQFTAPSLRKKSPSKIPKGCRGKRKKTRANRHSHSSQTSNAKSIRNLVFILALCYFGRGVAAFEPQTIYKIDFDSEGRYGAVDYEKASEVINILNYNSLQGVYFDPYYTDRFTHLHPLTKETYHAEVTGGLCTSTALHFLSNALSCEPSPEHLGCVVNAAQSYESLNLKPELRTLQWAFNTIHLFPETNLNSGDMPSFPIVDQKHLHSKVDSMLDLFGMQILEESPPLSNLQREENAAYIDSLSAGFYFVRSTAPENNHKQESVGHSMAFYLHPDKDILGFFFDPSYTASLIESGKQGEVIEYFINENNYQHPIYSIYKVACNSLECLPNLHKIFEFHDVSVEKSKVEILVDSEPDLFKPGL